MGCQQSKTEKKVTPLAGSTKKANISGASLKKPSVKSKNTHSSTIEDSEREDKKSARSSFVQKIIDAGQPWTDPEFPPVFASLAKPESTTEDTSKFRDIEWKRIPELYDNPKVFCQDIRPSDICQGALGDCYFLAVLSSMAEFPDRIKALFETRTINPAGIYLLKFYVNGLETSVVVDDYLPVVKGTNKLAFAHSDQDELWVSLLEKGWAKLHGSYAATSGGIPDFAANHLAGVPSEALRHEEQKDLDSFWETLKSADRRKFTIMASSLGEGEEENDDGIISGHAYSVVSIHEFMHAGEEIRLLKLRNPWGHGEWNGDWSDNSDKWTPELRQMCGSVIADDGFFFIPFKDYWEEYCMTSLCAEQDESKYFHSNVIRQFANHKQGEYQAFYKFSLQREIKFDRTVFAISVFQQGDRLATYRLRNEQQAFKPAQFNIMLMKPSGQFVKANFGSAFMQSLLNDDLMLAAGDYILMIDPVWNDCVNNDPQEYKKLLIDIYGPQQVFLEEMSRAEGIDILVKSIKHAAMALSPEDKKVRYLEERPDYESVIRVQDLDLLNCWYGFIYTNNLSPYTLEEEMKPVLEGLEVIYPEQGEEGKIDIKIEPREEHVIIMRRYHNQCRYSTQYMTHRRRLTVEEMMNLAKQEGQVQQLDSLETYFKLYNTNQGTVFYFNNPSATQTVTIEFNLTLKNLALQDAKPGASSFRVVIAPQQETFKVLLPIQRDQSTSIKMGFSFSAEEL